MGDRCEVRITVLRADYDAHGLGEFFQIEEDFGDGLLHLYVEEANYGYWQELNDWAIAGAVFIGNHGQGGSYEGGSFASDGENYYDAEGLDGPTARIHQDGTIDEHDWQAGKEFWAATVRACERLGCCVCCHKPLPRCEDVAKRKAVSA